MSLSRYLACVAVLVGLSMARAGQPPERMPPADDEPAIPGEADVIKLPGAAKAVVLSLDKYQELLAELKRLQKRLEQLEGEPRKPSHCRVTGQITSANLAQLHIHLEFKLEEAEPKRLFLGCGAANLADAKIDGQKGAFKKTEEGFVVAVSQAGEHEVDLDMELSLVGKENEKGFSLDLPPSVTRSLELSFPKGIKTVRINKEVFETKAAGEGALLKPPALDAQGRLDVGWADQVSTPILSPLVDVETRLVVRVEESQALIEAEMTVKSTGPVSSLQLLVPPEAEWVKKPGLDERIVAVEAVESNRFLRNVRLKDSGQKPIALSFRVLQPREKEVFPAGPFAVLGAATQQTSIVVAASPDLRITFRRHGYVVQKEISDDERRRESNAVAAFRLLGNPPLEKGGAASTQAPLEIEAEPLRGEVEAKVVHVLRLVTPALSEKSYWRLTTTIEGEALRTRPRGLGLQLPSGYRLDESVGIQPSSLLQGPPVVEPITHVAWIPLATAKPGPFKLTIEGFYSFQEKSPPLSLSLPLFQGTLDRGASVTVQLPESLEWAGARGNTEERELTFQEPHRLTWSYRRAPQRFELDWQAYRPECVVPCLVDLNLQEGQVRVRQRFRFESPVSRSGRFQLDVPPSCMATLEIKEGGTWEGRLDRLSRIKRVLLDPVPADATPSLVVEYVASTTTDDSTDFQPNLTIPLIKCVEATQGETRVRVWPPNSLTVRPGVSHWQILPPEEAADHTEWPSLVLRSAQPAEVLKLVVANSQGASLANLSLQRVLLEIGLGEASQVSYRARFHLGETSKPFIDARIPGSLATMNLRAAIDGKPIAWQSMGSVEVGGRNHSVVRLAVPASALTRSCTLELVYQDVLSGSVTGLDRVILAPPKLVGAAGWAPVRWAFVTLENQKLLMLSRSLEAEQQLAWHGVLPGLGPTVSERDLDRWLEGNEGTAGREESQYAEMVVHGIFLHPVEIVLIPRLLWRLFCSLVILSTGLAGYFLTTRRLLFTLAMGCFAVLALVITFFQPGLLIDVVFGGLPGLVVLSGFGLVHWVNKRKQQRRLLFLPAYPRSRAKSSVVRSALANGPRIEPSTVDVAAPLVASGSPSPKSSKVEKSSTGS